MRIQEWKHHPDFPAGSDSLVRGCWEFQLCPGEATIAHQHDDGQEIDLIVEGTGWITVGDRTREVSAGDVIFVPAGTRHLIRNESSPQLRGLTVECTHALPPIVGPSGEEATIQDLEEFIASIPDDLDVSGSLQAIIRLFDLAGYISEQIDESLGLDSDPGYEALKQIEQRVMDAVVEISSRYQLGCVPEGPHPRF